jgi:ectoine hydroxylase-related dioxygenase (phytanoyl-CoA dioxygenase family)
MASSADRSTILFPALRDWLASQFGKRPASSLRPTLMLSQEQIEAFREEGYLSIPQITTAEEIAWIREIYDRLFDRRCGWGEGNFFDFTGTDDLQELSLPQMLLPSKYEPALEMTLFRINAAAVARQLLGPRAELVFEHAILKPPRVGPKTPWHQDQAFFPAGTNYESLTVWMPLQDVTEASGCMKFIPRSHREPLLRHRAINDDSRVHGLEAIGVEERRAIACPLAAGGATVHDYRTLHGAGPNLSEVPRRAYALGFGVRSRRFLLREDYSWNAAKRTARQQRYLTSRRPMRRIRDRMRSIRLYFGV